ncbi:hypothetical protein [Paracoccus tegillarcae]|uniref:Uncharacterized protein n=1 Tax=Paracoccus tegillarcae TaxID=1529068 RepID=A0A2K9EH88_9RHOB|nr:hypothetical protein [Paracoccus tegillarcae]AUH32687.1 hypothetical protein CUV01_04185 [Paracoccus tegillarcae]
MEQVWAAWRSCTAPVESGPAFHYAAHRMNPDLLGSRVVVSGQPITRGDIDDVVICVMLSVAPSHLVFQDASLADALRRSPFLIDREILNG